MIVNKSNQPDAVDTSGSVNVQAEQLQKKAEDLLDESRYDEVVSTLTQTPQIWTGKIILLLRCALDQIDNHDARAAEALSNSLPALSKMPDDSDTARLVTSMVSGRLKDLIVAHRLQAAHEIVTCLSSQLETLPRELRVHMVRRGLQLAKADELGRAQQISTMLLDDWPDWPAAQRLFRDIIQHMIDGAHLKEAGAFLARVTCRWPEKDLLGQQVACQKILQNEGDWPEAIQNELVNCEAFEQLIPTIGDTETRLLEDGRYDAAVVLAAAVCGYLPEHGYDFRKRAIRRVTRLINANQPHDAVPLMENLLRDWPLWPAAQRVSVRLARALLKEDNPDVGMTLLDATPHIWLDKALFKVSHALWHAERGAPDWRVNILQNLRDATSQLQTANDEVRVIQNNVQGYQNETDALVHLDLTGRSIDQNLKVAGTLRLVSACLSRLLVQGAFTQAHWIARKFGRIDSALEKDYRQKATRQIRKLVAEGALVEASVLSLPLLCDYPASIDIRSAAAKTIRALIEVGELRAAEDLLTRYNRKWPDGEQLHIALVAQRILHGDPNWKWMIHRIWRDLISSNHHKRSWIETQITTQFLDLCKELFQNREIGKADQIAAAISLRVPRFERDYLLMFVKSVQLYLEDWDNELVIRSLQSAVFGKHKDTQVRRAALSIIKRLHREGHVDTVRRFLSGAPEDWTEAQQLYARIILTRTIQDRTAGRQEFTRFIIDTVGSFPLRLGKLGSSVSKEIIVCFEDCLAKDALEDAWALQDWLNPRVEGLARKLRVRNVEIAVALLKQGQVKKAAALMHMACLRYPDWEAGERVAYRISCRLIKAREFAMATELMSVVSDTWPSKHIIALEYMIDQMVWMQADWQTVLRRWWRGFAGAGGLENAAFYVPVRDRMLEIAQGMMEDSDHAAAETTLLELRRHVTGDCEAHMLLAQLSEIRGDYRRATERWQMAAALAKLSNNEQGRYMLKHGNKGRDFLTRANFGLRSARCHLALDLIEKDDQRYFIEVVSRITESLGSTSIYQEDRLVLDVLSRYMRFCLADTHPAPQKLTASESPCRIVMCLDVLKLSDFHLHSRVVFTMSRSLLDRIPDLEIFVVITNERFAVTRPNIGSWIDFDGNDYTYGYAGKTVGDHFGKRFHLIFQRSYGLEGVVNSCKEILDLKPDLIAYAGGHGRYSNDSRIIRHTLFPYVPSVLFFLGVDNAIDDQVDMILPRGPHELVGDPGAATIRLQTYPTLPDGEERVKTPEEKPLPRYVVSALAGARFDTRMRDLPESDLRMLLQILDRHPDMVWNFVGADNPEQLVANVPLLQSYVSRGRLNVYPVMEINAFREFVTDATLFLQFPGFKGGAGGAGMARRSGVPVLTFANSDASGRQPPETVFEENDVAGIAAMASRLLSSPEDAAAVTQSQFDYAAHIRETSAYGFYDCLSETIRLARARMDRGAG